MSSVKYAEKYTDAASLSRPASGNHLKIEAQRVVDNEMKYENHKFENSNPRWP